MNKAHQLTVVLNDTAEDAKIKFLVDMNYELTKQMIPPDLVVWGNVALIFVF